MCFFALSCTKEIKDLEHITNLQCKTTDPIPYFSDSDQLIKEMERRISLRNSSLAELIAYETTDGYTSIGGMSDTMYFSVISDTTITTLEDFHDILQEYTGYITLSDVDTVQYCLPKFNYIPQRYIANRDGLYQVGDYVTRLFEKGTVTTKIGYLNNLISLSDSNLDQLDTTKYFFNPIIENDPSDSILERGSDEFEEEPIRSVQASYSNYYANLWNLPSWYFMSDAASIPHKEHSRVTSKTQQRTNGSYRVNIKLYYSFNIYYNGRDCLAYVQCQSLKKKWYGLYVLEPTNNMDINVRTLSCVEDEVYMSAFTKNISSSQYIQLLYVANVYGTFTSYSKYVHFRASRSYVKSDKVTNGAWITFGAQTYF